MFKKPAANRLNQRDLGRLFGVSQVTVSRALRQTGQVDPKLETDIINAARQHGYSTELHFGARAMSHRRHGQEMETDVICAIVLDYGEESSDFTLRVTRGIRRGAREVGSELLIVSDDTGGRLPRVVARRQVDGVVWLLGDESFRSQDPSCPVPLVSLMFPVKGADMVAVNDRHAMAAIGAHLADFGHRRVAFLGPDNILAKARLAGLRAGLKASGGSVAEVDVQLGPYAMEATTVLPLARALLERRQTCPAAERVSAIAVYNDYMAQPVIRCARDEYGLRVPDDVSITGFDGTAIPGWSAPKLTTAAIPLEDLGAKAVHMIAWRMQNPEKAPRRVTLDAPLRAGETVAQVRASGEMKSE